MNMLHNSSIIIALPYVSSVNNAKIYSNLQYSTTVMVSGNRSPLVFSASSSNSSLATVSYTALANNQYNITVTPVAQRFGDVTVTMTYTDSISTQFTTEFNVTVLGK